MAQMTVAQWLVPAFGVALAGMLRGFSGFGFALAAVPLLSWSLPVNEVVPLVTVLQTVSCLPALGRQAGDADWRHVAQLIVCAPLGLLPGLWLLRWTDDRLLGLAVGVVELVCIAVLSRGYSLRRRPAMLWVASAGVASGFLQGLAGMAGPPVIVLQMAWHRSARATRATLTAFFLCISVLGVIGIAASGLLSRHVLLLAAIGLPLLFIGQTTGQQGFILLAGSPVYRRLTLLLLALIAVTTIGRSLIALLH